MAAIALGSVLPFPQDMTLSSNVDSQVPLAGQHACDAASAFDAHVPSAAHSADAVAGGSFISMGPDDTIWSVVGRSLWTGATAHQIVAALVKANPSAFEPDLTFGGDHQRLKPEVTRLFLPSVAQILSISDNEAGNISATIRPGEQNLRRLGPGDQELIFGDDTVELLAKRFQVERATLSQKMVAIFNANREMFNRGNMNTPKYGEVIAMPATKDVLAIDDKSAARIVSDHLKQHTEYVNGQKQAKAVTTPAA